MSTADVSLRGFQIAQSAEVTERGQGRAFIALEQPPPVRAVLEVVMGDERRGLIVESVDESGRGEAGQGCLGVWTESDAFDRARDQVGSEHLESGSADDGGSTARNAPVVVTDEPSGVIDMNSEPPPDDESQGSDAAEAGDDDQGDDDGQDGDDGGQDEGDDGSDENAASDEGGSPAKKSKRTKKRKGRKRS